MDFSSTTATCTHGAMLASLSEVEESFSTTAPLSAIAKAARVIPKSKESGSFRSKSRDISKCFSSPKAVPSAASTTPFLQPLDFRKSASFSGELMTSARLREKFLSKISRAVPSPSAAKDTVSESSKAGSAFPARDFSAALILSKKSFLSIFFEPFSKFAAPEFRERAGFQPPAERPDSKGVYRQQIREPIERNRGAPDFRRGRNGAPRLESDVVCDFQRLGFNEVAHFQNQVGEGDFRGAFLGASAAERARLGEIGILPDFVARK